MLYERYKNRIERVAEVLKFLKRYRLVFLAIGLIAVALTGSFLATQGDSDLTDSGERSGFSYTFSNIFLPIFDMIMEFFRDTLKNLANGFME